MRWLAKRETQLEDTRVRIKFAVWPRRCGPIWVWLERVQILEAYRTDYGYFGEQLQTWEAWEEIDCEVLP